MATKKDADITFKIGFQIQKQNLEQLKTSLQGLQKLSLNDLMKINNADVQEARKILATVQDKAQDVENALSKAFNPKLNTVNIETFNSALKQSGLSMEDVYQTFKKAGPAGENAFRNLTTSVLNTNIQLKESHKILDKMAETFANTVKWNIASTAVNGVTRSIQQAWGYIQNLDTSLNDIRVVTGKTADEMADFAVKANEAAKALGQTTTDYTNAALIYAQQGLSDAEIEERAKITLKAANVTGQSTDAVSEQLTAVWNGYKVTAEEAELYVDRLAAVAATSASNLEELSTGMSKVASAAAAMGVGEDQLAAQLSTIISVTRQAPESVGTALRTVYARISDIKAGLDEDGVTLGNYTGRMASLGINVLDVTGNLRDMGDVMEEIGGKWGNLTREQQVYLAQTMAGQRQYNNLLALFDNFEKYNQELNIAQNAAGTLQKQQDIYMESTASHLKVLKASVEDVYDSLIDTKSINPLIDALSKITTLVAQFIDGIGGGGAVLRTLGSIGVTVFSEQIAKGLNTTLNNIERSKENARQFDQALQFTSQWKGIPELKETTKNLLASRQQMLNLAKVATPEQFTEMQNYLSGVKDIGNEIALLSKQKQKIDNLAQTVSGISLDNIVKDQNVIDKVTDDIDTLSTTLTKKFSEELPNSIDAFAQQIDKDIFSKLSGAALASKLKGTQFTQLMSGSNGFITQLRTQIDQFKDTPIFDGLSTNAQTTFNQIEANWAATQQKMSEVSSKSDKQEIFIAFFEKIKKASEEMSTVAENNLEEVRATINNSDLINTLDKQQKIFLEKYQQFLNQQQNMQRAATINNITKTIGSFTQIFNGIKQIQNLGSVWKNADLSSGQKLTQIITNLLASLPMLITGFVKLRNVLNFAGGGAITGVAIAISAIAAVIGAIKNAQKEATQAAIDANNAIIESENKKQEEIQANKNLINSLEDLDKKYQDQEINRLELKSAVQDLIDQYNLEGAAADRLSAKYDNLASYIAEARVQANKEARASAQREIVASKGNVLATAKQDSKYNNTKLTSDQYQLKIETFEQFDPTKLLEQFRAINGVQEDGQNFVFRVDNDISSIINLYDQLNKIYTDIGNEYDPDILSNSIAFTGLENWLNTLRPDVEKYKQALKDVTTYETQFIAADQQNFNASTIQNAEQYVAQRQHLIEAIQKQNINIQDPAAAVDAYLKENYRDLYLQFDDYSNILQKFETDFGTIDKNIAQKITTLDTTQLDTLMQVLELHPQTINNWELLSKIIKEITETESNFNTNIPSVSLQQAAQTYNTYQPIEDTVRKGNTISLDELQTLTPDLQSFFTMVADGTYKMTGNAKDFYSAIEDVKLQGFRDHLAAVNQEIENIKEIQKNPVELSEGTTYKDLQQSAYTEFYDEENDVFRRSYNLQLVQEQLNYLRDTKSESVALIEAWETLNSTQGLTKEQLEDIANSVARAGDLTGDLTDELTETTDEGIEAAHRLYDAMFPTDSDIDVEALESLSETIQNIADESKDLADSLTQDTYAAGEVAEAILRFDNAIVDVVDNYENWMAALTSGSAQEQAEAIIGLKDAYADLLDLDGASLSEEFLTNTENLELMKTAIEGDAEAADEAYNKLMQLAQQDIVAHLQLSNEDYQLFMSELTNVQNSLDEMNFQTLEIGASLNDANFLDELTNMVNAANMTAEQATDYLSSMGVDAEVVEQKTEGTSQHQYTGAIANVQTELVQGIDPISGRPVMYTIPSVTYEAQPFTVKDTQENSAFSLKVTSAHKSSGGGFKFSQAKNGGGSAGVARRASTPKSSGGGGGSKGGSSSPDTSKKDTKKPIEDTRDIYHDINIELQQIDRQLDRVQKKQDQLYGKALLDNLKKQQELLEKHKKTLLEKQKLQEWDLQNQRQTLQNLGVTFDAYGNISNYLTILGIKQAEINVKTKEYNDLILQYNASTDKDAKKQIADQAEAINKQLKEMEDDYKDLQDKIKDYDGLREDMEDLVDDITEETQKQIEIEIKKFRMELEIRLDLGEAERDWNKFRREVLEHTNVLKDSDFDKIYSDAILNSRDITSYFNTGGSGTGSVEALTNQIFSTLAQLNSIDTTGSSDIYGEDKAQAMEDLQNDLNELMGQIEDIEGLIDDIDKAYLDTIDDIDKNFDKQIEDYEFVGELIEHDIDLLTLLYGDKQYEAMNKYFTALETNNNKQLDSLRKQRDFWKAEWDAAVARGDTKAAEKFEKNYKDTIKSLNSLIDESVKNLQSKYENAINQIFDTLDKKISNGKGTDYLSMEWELMHKNADEYLDTINSAFAIQDTQRKYQQAIDDTKSIKGQQALKKLMDEQVDILKNKEKITEYDVERAERLLQVEQARIALEDARAAKTTMRLKRDSQGNYSYEYVADNDQVEDLQGQLASAQQDLYNFDKEAYRANLNDMLSAWKDFQSEYKQIQLDTSLSDEERIARLQLLQDQYGEYINNKTAENSHIRNNLEESAFDAVALLYENDKNLYSNAKDIEIQDAQNAAQAQINAASEAVGQSTGIYSRDSEAYALESGKKVSTTEGNNKTINEKIQELFGALDGYYQGDTEKFTNMTEAEKAAFVGQNGLVPEMNSGIQEMADAFVNEGGFLPTCESAFEDLDQATNNYKNDLDNMAQAAGLDLGNVKSGVDDIALSMSDLILANDLLIDRMKTELGLMSDLKQAAEELMTAYEKVYDAAREAAQAAYEYRKQQQLDAAQAAAEATQKAAEIAQEAVVTAENALKTIQEANSDAQNTDVMSDYERLIEGLAGSVWTGSWSNGDERVRRMMEVYGTEEGRNIYDAVQDKINSGFDYTAAGQAHDWDYYKQFDYKPSSSSSSTTGQSYGGGGGGGTTPPPETSVSKTAADFLNYVQTYGNEQQQQMLTKLRMEDEKNAPPSSHIVEQTVHITADFSGVKNADEIEKALNNVANDAIRRSMIQ